MYKKGLLSEINLKSEEDEFKRYKNPKKEMAAAKKGKTKTLKSLKGVSETDAADIEHGWRGLRKAAELQKKYKEDAKGQEGTPLSAKEGVKARRRVYNQIKSGKAEPSIIRRKGKKLELVAGNTRAMFSAALGKKIKAHIYDAPQNENLNTNEMKLFVQKGTLEALHERDYARDTGLKRPAKYNALVGGRIISSRRLGLANDLKAIRKQGTSGLPAGRKAYNALRGNNTKVVKGAKVTDPPSEGGVGAKLAKLASGSYHRSQRGK